MDDELENFIRERKARMAEDKASLEQDLPYMEIKAKPHRAYESTVKENIPPRSIAQEKEESVSVGLALGVEYERKKQRLQHERQMDYKLYLAQKKHLDNRRTIKQNLLENRAGILPRQRPPSRRDAATLTEDSKGLLRALRLLEVKTLCPEEDEEQSSVLPKHHDRLGRPVDQDSEEEGYCTELELMDGRRLRHVGVEKRQSNRTDGREKRENLAGRGSRALTRNEDAEFTTGLIIGAFDTEDVLQRKKQRYRQELQEQMAEQRRNKKREKDLGLKVAATGANDPEKQPDRIRQFGLYRRETHQVSERSAAGDGETSARVLPNNVKIVVGARETPPPEQPQVAFQSPLLEYSSALGLSPSNQPVASSFPRAMDTPRIPLFPPHPPSALSEAYRSLYGEPHHDYSTRNLLDPNMAYYGHLPVPGAGLPVSHWNVPPGGALPSQFGHHSPHSQHNGSSFPEPPIQPSHEDASGDLQVRVFPSDRSRSTKDGILSYREALNRQIQEQQERRRLEQEDMERYEARLKVDMKNHHPWGRGGGGAPLRDSTGNLITDLKQMHKLNEEAYSNPEQWQRRAKAALTARPELPDPNERVSGTVAECSSHDTSDTPSGFAHVQTSQFARGNVFSNQPSQEQLHDQQKYKADLKQQIYEKMQLKAEEMERMRLEEEKEEKRLAEQRANIQREYAEEQERNKRKQMEKKAMNEEIIQLAEQMKKEVERKKNEAEEKESAALRSQNERERQAQLMEVNREPSPPVPTLQKKHPPTVDSQHSTTPMSVNREPSPPVPTLQKKHPPRPPTVDSQHSTTPLSERSLSGLQSPPVPARRNQLLATGAQREAISELSTLSRRLRSEEKRLEGCLQWADWDDRHRERPLVDVFDMARLRLQAPVRRASSRNKEPRNLQQIHDSLQLKNTDGESRLGFSEVPKVQEVGVSIRRRPDYRNPYHQFSSQRSTVQDDYLDLSPPQQNDYLRTVMGGSARGSLLESDSAFIDPLGDASPVPRTPELEKAPQLSARERRRLTRRPQRSQDRAASSQPVSQQEDYSAHSGIRWQQEAEPSGEGRSRHMTGHLMSLGRCSNTAEPVELSDDSCSSHRFSPHNLDYGSSAETVSTDPWLRPGTSDTLKCLDRPSRRERLAT